MWRDVSNKILKREKKNIYSPLRKNSEYSQIQNLIDKYGIPEEPLAARMKFFWKETVFQEISCININGLRVPIVMKKEDKFYKLDAMLPYNQYRFKTGNS